MLLKSQHFRNLLVYPLVLISTLGVFLLQKDTLNQEIKTARSPNELKEQQRLKQIQLKAWQNSPPLGFDNIIADLAYLNLIQYYGDTEERELTSYDLAPEYFKAIVEKDPRFVTAYLIAEPATTLFAGRPDVSVKLMNEGLKFLSPRIPLAYQVLIYKGIDEILFLDNLKGARQSYLEAAKWAKLADSPESLLAANMAQNTADFLATNPDSKVASAGAWLQILSSARDDKTRKIAIDNLKRLGASIKIEGNKLSVSVPQAKN